MNKKILIILLVSIIVLAATIAECTTTQGPVNVTLPTTAIPTTKEMKTYIVGIDAPYPPFSFMDEKGNLTGLDVESIRWIAAKEGFKVEFQQTAWDGIIPALLAKKIDMIYSGMTITPERLEKVNFTIPYWVINQDVYILNSTNLTIADVLAGKAILGTQRGCTAELWIEANLIDIGKMPKDNLKLYDNTPLAINDLEAGRISAVMYDDLTLKDMVQGKAVKKDRVNRNQGRIWGSSEEGRHCASRYAQRWPHQTNERPILE
jgi:polar amino acid transport system substrate-binding protein